MRSSLQIVFGSSNKIDDFRILWDDDRFLTVLIFDPNSRGAKPGSSETFLTRQLGLRRRDRRVAPARLGAWTLREPVVLRPSGLSLSQLRNRAGHLQPAGNKPKTGRTATVSMNEIIFSR